MVRNNVVGRIIYNLRIRVEISFDSTEHHVNILFYSGSFSSPALLFHGSHQAEFKAVPLLDDDDDGECIVGASA